MYDRTSNSYDTLYKEEQAEKYFIAVKSLRPKGRVLDIGCGTALFLEFISNYGMLDDIEEYVCLDYSEGMLQVARRRIERLCRHKCLALLGEACSLPFRSRTFDRVYSFTVIDLIEDPRKGINEALRVSRNGAVLSFLRKLSGWRKLGKIGTEIGRTDKDILFLIKKTF